MNSPFPHRRVNVIGTTSTGKSTLAAELARRWGVNYVELDALYWEPNWIIAPLEVFRERVEAATRGDGWVADGNYRQARDILWARVEAILWLDYGFWVTLGRLVRRTWDRIFAQEELWNGNHENIWNQIKFWSEDSLFHWFFKSYWRRKREVPAWFEKPEYAHLTVIRFRSPREAEAWLKSL
jgi:adenylate kinase family enzyme